MHLVSIDIEEKKKKIYCQIAKVQKAILHIIVCCSQTKLSVKAESKATWRGHFQSPETKKSWKRARAVVVEVQYLLTT